jgi:anaerobic ribonucleoside-triphosphate reductase
MSRITTVHKRDGRTAAFTKKKIADAIFKAAKAVGGEDMHLANELAGVVTLFLEKHHPSSSPGIEDIQDMVEKVLIETGHARTAKAYILYRQKRAEMREKARVLKHTERRDSTDRDLMVDGQAIKQSFGWDRRKIAEALVREADVSSEIADEIASAVEKRVFDSGTDRITTTLIRALVDNELFNRGLTPKIERQAILGMPKYDLEQLIFSKSNENSNIAVNNPEAINLAIAEYTLKQYALSNIFSSDVSDAHRKAVVHLHDLGYPVRVYCSSHSIEYLKKYGLSLGNLETSSGPAKHARTLTGHLNTFLASMQAYYAGALGVAYVNIMYAPYVEHMSDREMLQEAQHLIFSSSQNAFSRGGQTLFLDFNIHTGIPTHLQDVPAIGPGGKCDGRTYGDFQEPADRFTKAMLEVWRRGDQHGHLFRFPKCDFHITDETFEDPRQTEILDLACQIASENGIPYFVFDRDAVILSACCRLRTRVTDMYLMKHPESLRFCGFQNVTINLPQCAYRAGSGNLAGLRKEIEGAMDIAMKAHLQKKSFARHLMSAPGMPLWEVGKPAADGEPYIDLDKATYIIGLIGLNECLRHMIGAELHDSGEALFEGLRIVSFMNLKAKEMGDKYGLKVSLEESPAESAARRFAKIDYQRFPESRKLVMGDVEAGDIYYTNSVHLRPDAPTDLVTRIKMQSAFHSLIDSGAIIHAFVGEKRPSAGAIRSLVKKTHENTKAAQLTISPEFSVCGVCHHTHPGLKERCPVCGQSDVAARQLAEVEIEGGDRGLERFEQLLARSGESTN